MGVIHVTNTQDKGVFSCVVDVRWSSYLVWQGHGAWGIGHGLSTPLTGTPLDYKPTVSSSHFMHIESKEKWEPSRTWFQFLYRIYYRNTKQNMYDPSRTPFQFRIDFYTPIYTQLAISYPSPYPLFRIKRRVVPHFSLSTLCPAICQG